MPDFNFLDTIAERPDPSGRSRTQPSLDPTEIPVAPVVPTAAAEPEPAPVPRPATEPVPAVEPAPAREESLTTAPPDDRPINEAFAPLTHAQMDDEARLAALFDDAPTTAHSASVTDTPAQPAAPLHSQTAPQRTELPAAGTSAPEPDDVQPKRSRWPLYVFGVIAFLLVGLSFIWYVNPYPPLRDTLSDFFKRHERTRPATPVVERDRPAGQPAAPATDSSTSARDWDYFIQVSSWKSLGTAQREANLLRARQLAVAVEGDYNRARRGTVFRVRIGPLATRAEASTLLDSLRTVLPEGAFVDSVRTTGAAPPPVTGPQIIQPAPPTPRQERAAPATTTRPTRGFAVKISSYRAKENADSEANSLVKKGFPAYVVPVMIGEVQWYRVLVGPLTTREDADRYARSVRSISGNEAFVIELGR